MRPSGVGLLGQQRGGARIPPEAAVCVEGSPQGVSKLVTLAAELPGAPHSGPACGEGQFATALGQAGPQQLPAPMGRALPPMEQTVLVLATCLFWVQPS